MRRLLLAAAVVVFLASCYGSLWYGFSKGYEYALGQNLSDSYSVVHTIQLIEDGKYAEATNSLEQTLDMHVLERSVSDTNLNDYLIFFPKSNIETQKNIEKHIKLHRAKSNYMCTTPKNACEIVNQYFYQTDTNP